MTLTKKIKSIMLAAMEIAKAVSFAWMYKMIKIDMEMPVSCIDCKLFRVYYENNEQEWSCGVVFKIINKIDEKPIWCPLIEVK